MAPKKANPMEDPPAASSEEEEEESDEEETSSGEEEEDDEETPEPTQLSSPPSKQIAPKKPTPQVATPAKSSSSEDEETGSDSESESDPEQTPKPIASKPMEETTSKARSSKPVLKRANETEVAQKDAKRKKKGTGAGAEGGRDGEEEEPPSEMKKPGEEMKKQLFQRLWSEDDEIAVLKGMMEFSIKKGIDPNQDMNAFHDFIKKSLHIDVSRTQLMDKIRRLKKKYVNNLKRGMKKGEDVNLSKPHEQKAYELSKKIWGGEDGNGFIDSPVKSNGKAKKVQSQKGNSKQPEPVNGPKEADRMLVDVEKESTLKVTDVEKFLLDRSIGVAGLEDYVINNGLTMVGAPKKTELEKRWKKLQIAQLELYVERSNLVREQAILMLDALKSSDDN